LKAPADAEAMPALAEWAREEERSYERFTEALLSTELGSREAQGGETRIRSARYERASVIVTSNKPFSAWGEIFGEETAAAAMIDRLVHHAEIVAMSGESYRLKDKRVESVSQPAVKAA
jgi:hypothetical protein